MAKYEVKLSEEDLQMIKDCHSKNPSIMKAMNEGPQGMPFLLVFKSCTVGMLPVINTDYFTHAI